MIQVKIFDGFDIEREINHWLRFTDATIIDVKYSICGELGRVVERAMVIYK